MSDIKANIQVLNGEKVYNMLPKRIANSHKGTYGHVLNIAGSTSYTGAAFLSSITSLKVGAGYCILASCTDVLSAVSCLSPDITFLDLGQSSWGTIPKDAIKYLNGIANCNVISIGCGLSTAGGVSDFVINFLKKNKNSYIPVIIDADALNIIASTKNYIFPLNSVITPHPLELSRLMGIDVNDIMQNRVKWAWEACKEYDCIVVLKGRQTVIAIPNGRIFINQTGNSSLAKAGTGDVLTGMISGFCAQGIPTENAVCSAVYLHGLASEIASNSMTEYSVLASDLLRFIPLALRNLLANNAIKAEEMPTVAPVQSMQQKPIQDDAQQKLNA